MEGLDVYDRDGEPSGRVVEERQGFLIVEAGLLFKTQRAVPQTLARVDGSRRRVDLLISHELVDDSPPLEADLDVASLKGYYAHVAAEVQEAQAPVAVESR